MAEISLKIEKWDLFFQWVKYLGHIVKSEIIEDDQADTNSLIEENMPNTPTQLSYFFRFVNVYRNFISKYTTKAEPLYFLLKYTSGNKIPEQTSQQLRAFYSLIEAVFDPVIQAISRSALLYSPDTDTSDYQL